MADGDVARVCWRRAGKKKPDVFSRCRCFALLRGAGRVGAQGCSGRLKIDQGFFVGAYLLALISLAADIASAARLPVRLGGQGKVRYCYFEFASMALINTSRRLGEIDLSKISGELRTQADNLKPEGRCMKTKKIIGCDALPVPDCWLPLAGNLPQKASVRGKTVSERSSIFKRLPEVCDYANSLSKTEISYINLHTVGSGLPKWGNTATGQKLRAEFGLHTPDNASARRCSQSLSPLSGCAVRQS